MSKNTSEYSANRRQEEFDDNDIQMFDTQWLEATEQNRSILHSYQNLNVWPTTQPNSVMVVGTGGSGLWERSWKRRALEGATQPYEAAEYEIYQKGNTQHGPMRAMCFATDLARQHMLATRGISSDYNHERHPDDWITGLEALELANRNCLELGQHLTYLGILNDDENMLATGRRIMGQSENNLTRWLDDDAAGAPIQETLAPENADWPAVGAELATLAEQRIHYVEKLVELAGVDPDNERQVAEARQFLAEAVVATDLSEAYHQNISYLHEVGAKEGSIPSLMRSISDHTFRDNRSGIGQMMAKMLDSKHQEQTEHAYRVLHNMQEQMVAIAYAYDQTGDRLD